MCILFVTYVMCMKNRWNPTIDRSQKCQGCTSFKWRTLVESFALECHHGSRGTFRVTGDIKPNANVYGWDGDGSGMKYPYNFYKISVRAGEIWYVVNRSYVYINIVYIYNIYIYIYTYDIHIYIMPKQWVAFLLNFVDDEKMFLKFIRRLFSPFNSASIR